MNRTVVFFISLILPGALPFVVGICVMLEKSTVAVTVGLVWLIILFSLGNRRADPFPDRTASFFPVVLLSNAIALALGLGIGWLLR